MNRQWVTIRQLPGETPDDAGRWLEETLDAAGFWSVVESVRHSLRSRRDRLRIAVKPDLDAFDTAVTTGTDPLLVEHLTALLISRGFSRITVIDARNCRDGWLLNREPLVVADLTGYDLSGRHYVVSADPEAWWNAHFRINFARNRTHESWLYALCVHNLAGVGPGSAGVPERCQQVLRAAPPHFNLIDAWTSCHGPAGQRVPQLLATRTFIASPNALLADLAGAAKMGLDPYVSGVNARAFDTVGLPDTYEVDGSLAPYALWRNVHPLMADSARRRNETPGLGAVTEGWFQRTDRESFPFREFHQDSVNSFVVPLLERIGTDTRSTSLVVLLNYALAGMGHWVLAQHTLFSKDKLVRRTEALTIDPEYRDDREFTDIPSYLAAFERLLADDPPSGEHQQRLRRLDGAVLFSATAELPVDYGRFVRRVKIQRAIQYMNDYIGGSATDVAVDGRGRVVRQAERNLYLQQPNWMVLFGGDVIDVEKLELIQYGRDHRTIYWRTVNSPNGSADCDDGRMTFRRTSDGQTRIEVFTRQKFTLPLFFHVADIDLLPGVRDPIVRRAYDTFFTRTLANLVSEFEGREYRAGHEGRGDDRGEGSLRDLARYFATAMATLAELLRHRTDFAGFEEWLSTRVWSPTPPASPVEDADGFRHFGPSPAGTRYDRSADDPGYFRQLEAAIADAPGFFTGLARAVQRDLEEYAAGADDTRPTSAETDEGRSGEP